MKYNNEVIIYIEYLQHIPFLAMTEFSTYNFELYDNEWLMYCEGGCGKNWIINNNKKIIDININYCEPEKWSIWVEKGYELPALQKGVKVLQKPLMLKDYLDAKTKYNNPFVIGEEVDKIYYCEDCKIYCNENFLCCSGCVKHKRK